MARRTAAATRCSDDPDRLARSRAVAAGPCCGVVARGAAVAISRRCTRRWPSEQPRGTARAAHEPRRERRPPGASASCRRTRATCTTVAATADPSAARPSQATAADRAETADCARQASAEPARACAGARDVVGPRASGQAATDAPCPRPGSGGVRRGPATCARRGGGIFSRRRGGCRREGRPRAPRPDRCRQSGPRPHADLQSRQDRRRRNLPDQGTRLRRRPLLFLRLRQGHQSRSEAVDRGAQGQQQRYPHRRRAQDDRDHPRKHLGRFPVDFTAAGAPRPQDNAGLEDFIMRDIFPDPRVP
jgi:hypothetical protein